MIEFEQHPAYPDAVLLPRESAIALYAEDEAGCNGLVYLNLQTGELLLCDGSDLVLWSGMLIKSVSLSAPNQRFIDIAIEVNGGVCIMTDDGLIKVHPTKSE
jgi:hypothetical protein